MRQLQATDKKKVDRFFLRHIKEPIIEVGCGQGYNLNYLKQKGFEDLQGIDVNEELIRDANKYYPELGIWKHDIIKEPLTRKFNSIILFEVIEHIQDTNKLLENLKEMLNEDGVILLTTPNVLGLRNRINFLFGKGSLFCRSGADDPHVRFFTPETLREKLGQHNLKVLREFTESRIPLLSKGLNGSITVVIQKEVRE